MCFLPSSVNIFPACFLLSRDGKSPFCSASSQVTDTVFPGTSFFRGFSTFLKLSSPYMCLHNNVLHTLLHIRVPFFLLHNSPCTVGFEHNVPCSISSRLEKSDILHISAIHLFSTSRFITAIGATVVHLNVSICTILHNFLYRRAHQCDHDHGFYHCTLSVTIASSTCSVGPTHS